MLLDLNSLAYLPKGSPGCKGSAVIHRMLPTKEFNKSLAHSVSLISSPLLDLILNLQHKEENRQLLAEFIHRKRSKESLVYPCGNTIWLARLHKDVGLSASLFLFSPNCLGAAQLDKRMVHISPVLSATLGIIYLAAKLQVQPGLLQELQMIPWLER